MIIHVKERNRDCRLSYMLSCRKPNVIQSWEISHRAINSDLTVFEDLLADRWNLNESQFKTYASIVSERADRLTIG